VAIHALFDLSEGYLLDPPIKTGVGCREASAFFLFIEKSGVFSVFRRHVEEGWGRVQ
jgi:hypothetical protein